MSEATPAVTYVVVPVAASVEAQADLAERAVAAAMEAGCVVLAEFVDFTDAEGAREPWVRRRGAQRLLAFVSDPRCEVGQVFVHDPAAAFDEEDLRTAVMLLRHHDIDVRLGDFGVAGGRGSPTARAVRWLNAVDTPHGGDAVVRP